MQSFSRLTRDGILRGEQADRFGNMILFLRDDGPALRHRLLGALQAAALSYVVWMGALTFAAAADDGASASESIEITVPAAASVEADGEEMEADAPAE